MHEGKNTSIMITLKKPTAERDGGGEEAAAWAARSRAGVFLLVPWGTDGRSTRAQTDAAPVPLPQGAGTRPWQSGVRGGCPAAVGYQLLHRPVRGRLYRQASRSDILGASRCCPLHTPCEGASSSAERSSRARSRVEDILPQERAQVRAARPWCNTLPIFGTVFFANLAIFSREVW